MPRPYGDPVHVASQTISLQELPVVGLVTHKMIAAELGVVTMNTGRQKGTAGSGPISRGLVARTSTWLDSRRNHDLHHLRPRQSRSMCPCSQHWQKRWRQA